MANCKRPSNALCVALLVTLCSSCAAHYIQIDHNEFRASGYPRPPLPPPLPPLEQLPQQMTTKELTPAELMVDLSNDLTYRILHFHSILNRNNFAFSPTALMSVLVALYEGAAGRSALELRNVLQLPNNRDVIRVGYRDIHRRLRTYFFGSENPLKGLSLNKDNVTISREYETILMFYGYDLAMDMVSNAPANATAATNETETTTAAVNETTTASTSVSTESPTTDLPETTTTVAEETSSSTEAPTTTEVPTTTEAVETTTEAAETTSETTPATEATETTEAPAEETTTPEGEAAELVAAFRNKDAEPLLRLQKGHMNKMSSGKLQAPQSRSKPKSNYLPSMMRVFSSPSRTPRIKRHFFGYKDLDANLFVTLFNQPTHHNLLPLGGPTNPTLAHLTNDFEVEVDPHFLTSGAKQNYNTADVISHVFYLGNQQIIHTTFKVYNAVLYFKYFDNLKMSVLELELDTPEYNLMILLPDFHSDMVTAAAALRLGPTLRLMRKQLKARWVQAIIPDFKLHGAMFLTNDLQNMGICDIFEPNRGDFRPMTDEKGIYVKHIEQSINVNIRTHPINQLKRNNGAQAQPIQISVNHPFLFFIVDRDLDVAVMAGRILNPLNVRIQ